ncbi:MAG: 4Fe-4S binding protein [Rikenellaceae bacterium]|nr:4Fe-4S binding protein [Rikenellaceae bacterium]
MLRKIRVILGVIFLALITLLFLDFTGILHGWLGWTAKVQLVPAILAANFIVVSILIILTLLFGRIYCSVVCPLGLFQDSVSWTAKRFKKKNRYSYSRALNWLRYPFVVLFIAALVIHITVLTGLLDPYAAFGRMAENIFAPVYRLGNNLLAYFARRADSYAFYPTEVWVKSWITFCIAVVTFFTIGYLAWRHGRTYCNTICPVGSFLGLLPRFSLCKPVIDPGKCTKCSLCSKNCKASCIDYKNYRIDHTRCVACMNCLDQCKFDALHYTARRPAKLSPESIGTHTGESGGLSRRSFLSIAAFFAVSKVVKAQAPIADGGLAVIEDKKIPERQTPVTPPGSVGAKNLKNHCTACQLCVSACPNNILRPSEKLSTFMQPEMSFERGYCRPECTRCSEVCPTGAIMEITPAEKSSLQVGRAVWIKENCIVTRDEVTCTACERNCPTGAITLIACGEQDDSSLKTPVVDTEICIGCGACEFVCPARPFSAIYVEGITVHRTI